MKPARGNPAISAANTPPLTSTEVRRALTDPRALCQRLALARGARRQRDGLMILCPWHEEKTPSCSVRVAPDRTIAAHCHACGASGDALSLIAAARGLDLRRDFREVLAEGARIAGLDPSGIALRPSLAKARPPASKRAKSLGPLPVPGPRTGNVPAPPPAIDDATFSAISHVLLDLGRLDDSPIARDVSRYLGSRKLLDLARADRWAALPPPGDTQSAWLKLLVDVFGREALEASGLVWRRGKGIGFAHPAHRLVIPWRSPDGAVTTLQRRRIDRESEKKYVFPAGRPTRFPYGIEKVRPGETLAIAEGAADVLALRWLLRRDGVDAAVVGLAGAQSWDGAYAKYAGERAIIGLDADRTGHLAVGAIAHDLVLAGVTRLERWKPRVGKDWADTLLAERAE